MMNELIDAAVNVNIELASRADDSTSGGFNVFTITGIQRKEVRMCRLRLEESLYAPDGQRLRPDIVIETPGRLIIVEAKIEADEGYNQCAGYLETARALNVGKPVKLYFLSIDGHEACAISWRTHVLRWLEKVHALAQGNPRVSENVGQYMEAVKQISAKNDGELYEAMKNIINTPETVRAARTVRHKNTSYVSITYEAEKLGEYSLAITGSAICMYRV